MKNFLKYILLFFVLNHYSCSQTSEKVISVEDPSDILKNLDNFLKYRNSYLKLSDDFIALDSSSKVISKGEFLQQLSSGKFLPLRQISNETLYYKLYKINILPDEYISVLIKSIAEIEYEHYKMEGKALPKFKFVDIEGKVYNQETLKDKIIVLKCWFIKCQKCVEEMPALNKLVKHFESRKDIVFLSLALDQKKDLVNFLTKTSFNYAIVANQGNYVQKDLNVNIYPTHIIINKKGLIVKVVNSYEETESILKREALKPTSQ